jgi:phosphate transport system substrate-binding protein
MKKRQNHLGGKAVNGTSKTVGCLVLGMSLLGLLGCGGGKPRINGAGATFIYPMMSKWAAEYNKAKGVEVNYQSIGSGGGIQQMTAKTADFGSSDGPMNDEQLQKARETGGEVIHVPLAMGAVVPAYNLEGVDEPLTFTGTVLADIFLGKIKKWNDNAIRDLNPNIILPNKDIGVVHRSDGSGTTYVWVDYLSKVSPAWKQKVGVGTSVDWPVGEGAKGNEGVADRIKATPGALGYIELIYALQNDIKFGLVKNKEGVAIKADLKSVSAAAENALKDIPEDLRYSITDAAGKDSYPISGTNWAVLYVNQPAKEGKLVVDFLRWVIRDGQQYCEGLHYAKLPPGIVERGEKKLDSVQLK